MQALRVATAVAVLLIGTSIVIVGPAGAADVSGTELEAVVLTGAPGAMAESAVAIDPADTDHLVVAADPYLDPVRIVLSESFDGGRTWSKRVDIVPPGFAKSYDPSVAVMPGGRVVVLGGSSQQGAPNCQPGSAIFLAKLHGREVRYSFVQEAKSDTYVDRPRMTSDPLTGAMFATWTRSVGSGAECLAAPVRSSIMFTRSLQDGTFARPTALPSSGFPAPFGSSMAMGEAGSIHVAVRERDPSRGEDRIVLVSSPDGGRSFSKPEVLATAPAFPAGIPGLGGFVSGIPVIASDPEIGLTVVWPSSEPIGSRIDVGWRTRKGRWAVVQPIGMGAGYELFPSVSYDGTGRLWLLNARYSSGRIAFVLRHRGKRWSQPRIIARGVAGGYAEIGQFLGFTATGDRILAAVPIDGTRSRLKIFTKVLDTSATDDGRTGASRSGRVHRNANTSISQRAWVIALIVAAAVAVGGVVLRGLRHRSGTRPDTMPASDTTDV